MVPMADLFVHVSVLVADGAVPVPRRPGAPGAPTRTS